MIKIAISDDESFYREELSGIMKELFDFIDVESFSSGEELLATNIFDYDIILLDIEMGEMSGVEVAERIREKKCDALLIFVTSHTDCITQAMQTTPFQYIVKPLEKSLIVKQITRAIDKIKKQKNQISVKWKGEELLVNIDKVEYIEYSSRKLKIHCVDNIIHLSVGRMDDICNKLIEYDFIRVHNSYIVNLDSIDRIKVNIIFLKNGEIIQISKKYLNYVKEKFRIFISGVVIC